LNSSSGANSQTTISPRRDVGKPNANHVGGGGEGPPLSPRTVSRTQSSPRPTRDKISKENSKTGMQSS
jgi:hypothetical protein